MTKVQVIIDSIDPEDQNEFNKDQISFQAVVNGKLIEYHIAKSEYMDWADANMMREVSDEDGYHTQEVPWENYFSDEPNTPYRTNLSYDLEDYVKAHTEVTVFDQIQTIGNKITSSYKKAI